MTVELLDPEVTQETSTELAIRQVKTSVAALDKIKAGIAAIDKEHPKNLACDMSTPAGMKSAIAGRAAWRGPRVETEKVRKAAKAPVLQLGKEIDAFAYQVEALLLEGEQNYDEQIKAEETRKAVERAAQEQAKREFEARAQHQIDTIRSYVIDAAGKPSETIRLMIDGLEPVEITMAEYGDRALVATQAKSQTLAKLGEMLATAIATETEQARMAAEREELARMRAEQDEREKAERVRIAAEQKAEADRLAVERKRLAEEQAAAKAERDKADAEARAARDEADRIAREARAAEDQRIAKERAELEAMQRTQREAKEAADAAARKAEQKKADDAAKKERARLDKEAADRRAAEEKAHADAQRIRDASPAMLEALLYWRDECTGAEPSLSVFTQKADAALALAVGEPA